MSIYDTITYALRSTGRMSFRDRAEIIEVIQNGDYARVEVLLYRGKSKKPFMYWNICVDMARELIHWDTSTFYYI